MLRKAIEVARLSNKECLENLRTHLTLHAEQQIGQLDVTINSIKNLNASKGVLKSGRTITEVMRACTEIMEARVGFMTTAVQALPFQYSGDLEDSLKSLIQIYVPENLGGISERLQISFC